MRSREFTAEAQRAQRSTQSLGRVCVAKWKGKLDASVPPQRRKDAEQNAEKGKKKQNSAQEWSGMVVVPNRRAEEAENTEPEPQSQRCW